MYNASVFKYAAKSPPTKLIQSYYTCVLRIWDSIYAATGLAASNTQLYLGVAIAVYMFLLVYYQKTFFTTDIQWKSDKIRMEELKKEIMEEFTLALIEDFTSRSVVSISFFSIFFFHSLLLPIILFN